jgi:hypothetical protein
MRWLVVACIGCSSTAPRSEPPAEPPPKTIVNLPARAPADAAIDPDPDGDRIAGACDLCPTEAETYNGIIDEDGCPDSSGISHAVIEDPTNRYAWPIKVRFEGEKPVDMIDATMFDDGIESIDVIARSRVDVKPAVASRRATAVAKLVRAHVLQSVKIQERVTGASQVYSDDDVTDSAADVLVQVMRARGVEIWTWEDDRLVRATPRRRLPVPKLPPGC